MKDSKTLEFKINNPEIEKKFNIGIFQFEDYLAFYINLTAYDEHTNSQESTNHFDNPIDLDGLDGTQGLLLVKRPLIPVNSENITDRLRYIEISVGRSFEDDVTGEIQTDSGTHLIVFPYETECGDNSFSSDPAIINYYRQFFMRFEGEIRGMKFGFCNFRTLKRPIWLVQPIY